MILNNKTSFPPSPMLIVISLVLRHILFHVIPTNSILGNATKAPIQCPSPIEVRVYNLPRTIKPKLFYIRISNSLHGVHHTRCLMAQSRVDTNITFNFSGGLVYTRAKKLGCVDTVDRGIGRRYIGGTSLSSLASLVQPAALASC